MKKSDKDRLIALYREYEAASAASSSCEYFSLPFSMEENDRRRAEWERLKDERQTALNHFLGTFEYVMGIRS